MRSGNGARRPSGEPRPARVPGAGLPGPQTRDPPRPVARLRRGDVVDHHLHEDSRRRDALRLEQTRQGDGDLLPRRPLVAVLLDTLPAWIPSRNRLDRLTQGPKHQLAEPDLAARLLDLDTAALLRADQGTLQLVEGTILGALFEHLVTLSLQTYAELAEAKVFHLRTKNGQHEVDAIVQRRDGKVLAIEVKLSDRAEDADVKHLRWLADSIGDDLVDAAVITTGEHAYRRRDGIAVVPAALLGP
ncbi:DUF4143 domain-containing protein [Isoptericola sp. NPDC057191]|uniref:DUF4143 domain-containing protein n=1 Tax=Isoptericola sp. NPDC057191 TaxID=3346041 RepID=UPI00363FB28B